MDSDKNNFSILNKNLQQFFRYFCDPVLFLTDCGLFYICCFLGSVHIYTVYKCTMFQYALQMNKKNTFRESAKYSLNLKNIPIQF